jgi:mono/diheme cytochrome c family protein
MTLSSFVSLSPLAVLLAATLACSDDGSAGTPDAGRPPRDGQMAMLGDGLPCEVVRTLQTHCWGCHGLTTSGGAPYPLATFDDLKLPGMGGASRAERSVIRMRDNAKPMPPSGPRATEAEIAAVEQWVSSGMAEGTCDTNNCSTCTKLLDDVVACMPPSALPQFCDATDGPRFYQCAIQNCGTQCALAAPGQTPPTCMTENGPSCRACVEAACATEAAQCAAQ